MNRPTHSTLRKSQRTITVASHREDKKSKASSSLFPFKMIAKLERAQRTAQQNMEQNYTEPQQSWATNRFIYSVGLQGLHSSSRWDVETYCVPAVSSFKCIQESPSQFENRIMPRVYVRRITRSTMYQKAPFCKPELVYGTCGFSSIKIEYSDYPKS